MNIKYRYIKNIADPLINYLRYRDSQSQEGEDELWSQIIDQVKIEKRHIRRHNLYLISTIAASVLLLLSISVYYINLDKVNELDLYVKDMKPLSFNGEQVKIYLSSQKEIEIKEDKPSVIYSSDSVVNINQKEHKEIQTETLKEKGEEMIYDQIVTPNGKMANLTLLDGTKIFINSGSRVVYPRVFLSDRREIYIEGEAYLDVARDEQAPFIVKTSSCEIKVLGTSFNINAYKENALSEVVLVKGAVQLFDHHKGHVLLEPNQLAKIKKGKLDVVKEVDVQDYIAWKDGLLVFHFESLSSVCKRLERFYGCHISISPEAGKLKINGKISLNQPVDVLLEWIALSAPVAWRKEQNGSYKIEAK